MKVKTMHKILSHYSDDDELIIGWWDIHTLNDNYEGEFEPLSKEEWVKVVEDSENREWGWEKLDEEISDSAWRVIENRKYEQREN